MICNSNTSNTEIARRYDVCVVGAGPAGISLALELSEHDLSVCLIESGGLTISRKNQRLNQTHNVGIPYKDLSVQRARFLGGSSNFWGGNCIPLDPIDFRAISSRRFCCWPFPYSALEIYINKAQKLLGIDSSRFGDDLLKRVNLINEKPKNKLFELKAWQFCEFPFRFGDKFFDQLSMSKNITVFLNANVVDFEFCADGSVVRRAIVKNLKGETWRMDASNFVIACGAIENARILLNVSKTDSLNALNKLTSIGKNFAEHPNATIGYLQGKNAKAIYELHKTKYINGSKEIKPGLSISEEALEEKGILNGIISIWPVPVENNTLARAKILLELFRKKKFGLKFLVNTFWVLPGIVSLLPHVMHRLRGGVIHIPQRNDRFEVRLMTETLPNPCSRVDLTDRQDAIGLNKAKLDWRLSKQDRTSFSTIAGLAKRHLESTPEVELVLERWVDDDSIDWTQFINRDGHYGHHMGTTRMGLGPKDSVVDMNCKVHGLKNLYIAGSSVFPTFGFANPTLTIVALAIKLGDHLKQKLKG